MLENLREKLKPKGLKPLEGKELDDMIKGMGDDVISVEAVKVAGTSKYDTNAINQRLTNARERLKVAQRMNNDLGVENAKAEIAKEERNLQMAEDYKNGAGNA